MKIERFEDLLVWQKSRKLVFEIYKIFSKSRDFSFRDQIQRASVSIMNNVAEGFERKGNKEFIRFLFMAKGSCGEVRSMLYTARGLGYTDDHKFDKLYLMSEEISKILSGLIKKL
jgi:four helix bundle protein